MKTKFLLADPDEISPIALKYLSSALEEDNLDEILSEARRGEGSLIVIESDKIIGCMYLQICHGVLNIAHLGCESLGPLKDDLPEFIKKTMKEEGIQNLCILSRVGWHRKFKDLTPIGFLYFYNQ